METVVSINISLENEIQYLISLLSSKIFLFTLDLVKNKYKRYENKMLTNNVIKTVITSSRLRCMMLYSVTDGCLAVNVIGNHDITRELTTGLGNENKMEDYSSSSVFVLSKKFTVTNANLRTSVT